MPGRVQFRVTGDKVVSRRIFRLGIRARDMRPAWRQIYEFLRAESVKQFDSEGSHGGQAWPKADPDYVRRKISQGFDRRTLHRTLLLRKSLTLRGYRGQIYQSFPGYMRYGTSVPYAKYHQNPGTLSDLPRRAPLVVNRIAQGTILQIMRAHIRGGRRGRR